MRQLEAMRASEVCLVLRRFPMRVVGVWSRDAGDDNEHERDPSRSRNKADEV